MSNSFKRLGLLFLPNDEKVIPALLSYTEKITSAIGFSTKSSHSIQLALDETFMDVLKYAFEPGEEAELDVSFYQRPDGIEIRIHDMGLPVDPDSVPIFDPEGDLIEQNLDGLGSYLTKQLVDEYQFNNLGAKGKEVVLIKYFDSLPIVDKTAKKIEPEVVPEPTKDKKEEVAIEFEIRQMKPSEALEVCRCIYDCYGYSYANENIYYPERVVAMNETGKLLSAVAVTSEKEMAGHVAMIYYDHLPAEIGLAVTKKKFRKCGFARHISEFLENNAKANELIGIQIKEVTAHPYTQKFCAKLGYRDCGLLLAHSPKSLSFKGIADTLKQRNSDVLGFKYLKTPKSKTIYAPDKHLEIIEKIYNNLEVNVSISTKPLLSEQNKETIMSTNINPVRSLAEMILINSAPDSLQIIRQKMKKIFLDDIQVVEMYLNLNDPWTPHISNELEKIGFIFTGILPETKTGDCMILQYFNGVHVDYDSIVLVSEVAQELMDYVRKQDPHDFS